VETGAPQELLSRNGHFAHLAGLQTFLAET
jgi:ABC-type multidrug transport system fused ATPase/permease subunit